MSGLPQGAHPPGVRRGVWLSVAGAGLLVLLLCIAYRSAVIRPPVPPPSKPDRVTVARARHEQELRSLFTNAGLHWPPGEIFLRAMKREAQLEVWARDREGESFRIVRTYPIMAQSGEPGPKRREGDLQVPEGFYEVDRFNPESAFHLSLGLNYPNASDRILGDQSAPGFDIFVHGGAASVGCLAMGDAAIEQIYLIACDSRVRPVRAHFFPARIDAPDWPAWRDGNLARRPDLRPLWERLAEAWSLFESDRDVPVVDVEPDGSYRVSAGR